jgi:hypothetical protein
MTDPHPPSPGTWRYRFSLPEGGDEIEVQEFDGDESAEARARELSRARQAPIVIQRLHGHVDWRYVTEADERRD